LEEKAVSGIILALLLTSMLTLTFEIQTAQAEPKTWTVDDDGPAAFSKIQDAINAANPGDTVYVKAGRYDENIVVNKSEIALLGEYEDITIIDGRGTGNVIWATANRVNISHFTIQNSGSDYYDSGIYLGGAHSTIKDNTITNNRQGIHSDGSEQVISGNIVKENANEGIQLYYTSGRNTVSNNVIFSNGWMGITMRGSSTLNNITGNTIAINGGGILVEPGLNIIHHNNFINNARQVWTFSGSNTWDDGYPSGGNYWSDYSGVDDKSGSNQDQLGLPDGIGDTPYVIDANNRDRYPLMVRWAERKVGVKAGDWAKYTFEFSWSSTDPTEQPPTGIEDLESLTMTVLDVNDTTIAFQQVMRLKNGAETNYMWIVDVETGLGNGTYQLAFISADLRLGDRLHTSGAYVWCTWAIGETILRTYAGVARKTNHIWVTNWSGTPPSTDDFYWDRGTGILSERTHQQTNEREGYITSLSFSFKMVATNLWGAPPPSIVSSTLDTDPNALNLESRGKWITAYVQLLEGYNAADIDASTIFLNGTISPVLDPKYGFVTNSSEYLVDHNDDGILERMVKLDRATLASWIYQSVGMQHEVTVAITGELTDGTPFEGSVTILVLWQGQRSQFKR